MNAGSGTVCRPLAMNLPVMVRAKGREILKTVRTTFREAMNMMHLKPASVGAADAFVVSVRALVFVSDEDLVLDRGWDVALGFSCLSWDRWI